MNMEKEVRDLWAPLHRAVVEDDIEKVKTLLKGGAGINEREQAIRGYTPLALAVKRSNKEMVSLLIEMGANPEKGDNEQTCWEMASEDVKKIMHPALFLP